MAEDFVIEKRDGYLFVQYLAEEATADKAKQMIVEILNTCEACGCYDVIGETFAKKPMSPADAFSYEKMAKELGVPSHMRFAWVAHHKHVARRIKLVEMILNNRELVAGRVFESMEEAIRWFFADQPEKARDFERFRSTKLPQSSSRAL